jgi:hypothetical protein
MNKYPPIIFAASILLFAMLACAIPGQQAASVPTPTVDPAQLDAIVAETVAAALQQTASAPTATAAVTATRQPTPTETAIPLQQSSMTNQADGTTLFVDEKAGFNITVPPGWLAVRIDQIEYYDAFSLPQAEDPSVQTALMDINNLDPSVFRLFIFDLQDGHVQNGFVNNVNVIWKQGESISLKTDEEIKEAAEELPSLVPGLVVLSSSISTTAANILTGVILSEIASQQSDGNTLNLSRKQVFLNVKDGLLVLTFTSGQGIQDATLPFFDAMIESIQLGE